MSENIYLRITGGIGNQLFQLCKAYEISENKNHSCKIILCTQFQNQFFRKRSFSESDERFFSLHNLNLLSYNITHSEKVNIMTYLIFRFRFAKLFTRSNQLNIGSLYLDGYFIKDSNYTQAFDHFSKKIHKLIHISKQNECGLHVRAGDLLRQPQNQLCNKDYYSRAINYLKEKTNLQSIHVHTEDIEYAKSILPDLSEFEVKFTSSDEITDFLSLCSYQYLICANSTYSWMAGALGLSDLFISTEYFYEIGDKPQKLLKEVIVDFKSSHPVI